MSSNRGGGRGGKTPNPVRREHPERNVTSKAAYGYVQVSHKFYGNYIKNSYERLQNKEGLGWEMDKEFRCIAEEPHFPKDLYYKYKDQLHPSDSELTASSEEQSVATGTSSKNWKKKKRKRNAASSINGPDSASSNKEQLIISPDLEIVPDFDKKGPSQGHVPEPKPTAYLQPESTDPMQTSTPEVENKSPENATPSDEPSHPVQPQFTRNPKFIVKGLPVDFTTVAPERALLDLKFKCSKVILFRKRISGLEFAPAYRNIPIFLIVLPDAEQHRLITSITSIQDLNVDIQKFRKSPSCIQCFKCQGFGHVQRTCFGQPRCLKCAGGHRSFECTKDPSGAAKCCNCGLPHPANYTGCEARRRLALPQKTRHSSTDKRSSLYNIIEDLKEILKEKEMRELI